MTSEDPERGNIPGGAHHQGSDANGGVAQGRKSKWVEEFQVQAGKENDRLKVLQQNLYNMLPDAGEMSHSARALVLGTDADVNTPIAPSLKDGQRLVHVAAQKGWALGLRLLLEDPRLEVNLRDNQGRTALHLAAIGGKDDCIESLLSAGANTEVADSQGHLPRHYAQQHSDEGQRKAMTVLFDNPRNPLIVSKSATDHDSNQTQPPPMPLAEDGVNKNLADGLEGSFWEPASTLKWERKSVWDLIYSGETRDVERRKKKKKWFHLPAASQRWAHDLVKSIYHDSKKPAAEAQRVCKFIRDVFKEVDGEGQGKEYYFKREKQSRRYVGNAEAVAIVLPVIDIDRKKYVELSRKIQKTKTASKVSGVPEQRLLKLDGFMWSASLEGSHIERMLQLCIYHDQAVPQTLDQSYHGTSIDPARLEALDRDQVFTRYLRMLKDEKYKQLKQGSQRTIQAWARSAVPTAETAVGPDEFAVVPYFWLFKLDEDTILTLYPERWDRTSEAKLHMHLLNQISNSRDTQRKDVNMIHTAEHIVRSCMDFEASTFFKWKPPPTELRLWTAPWPNQDDVQISYATAFANSIGALYLQVVDRYTELQNGLGSLSLDATVFYRTTARVTKLLVEIDDIIGEIGMIRRIQTSQASAAKTLSNAIWGDLGELSYPFREDDEGPERMLLGSPEWEARTRRDERVEKRRKREELYTLAAIRPLLESFSVLEADAARVRSMLTTLLEVRHREAAIENVLSGKSQSTMLFIFTTITVLFAPLSFVSSLLALQIEDLPGLWRRSPLAAVFGYATLATTALCALMWLVYKLLAYQTAKWRNERSPPRPSSADAQMRVAAAAAARADPGAAAPTVGPSGNRGTRLGTGLGRERPRVRRETWLTPRAASRAR